MNSTTDVGNNAINNVKKLVDTGISSFVTVLWLIIIVSISLTILMITSLSIYSKYITNITNNTKHKLKQEQQQQSSS
jgi:ABC-type multidrug transport system fused ATPase/permease subunit